MSYRFLVIDDSELDCYIAEKKILHSMPESVVLLYKDAASALKFLSEDEDYTFQCTIVLLDILMPLVNGYDFMETFEKLDDAKRGRFAVVAITSSMYKNQIRKIYSFKSIKGVVEKPFSVEDLGKALSENGVRIVF